MTDEKEWIESSMGSRISSLSVKYLGVALNSKGISGKDCSVIIDIVKKRLQSWNNRFLSRAGRVVLIKSVVHSLIYYWARIFILPKHIIDEVNYLCILSQLWDIEKRKKMQICIFSSAILTNTMNFLGVGNCPKEWELIIAWFKNKNPKRYKTRFIVAGITLSSFEIWKCRNYKIFRQEGIQNTIASNTVIWNIKIKLCSILSKAVPGEDADWMAGWK
ncbi:hypothetical protein QQ045_012260 [Rhodiola kirilowii]